MTKTKPTLPRQTLTPAEAADRLPISLATLYRRIKRGEIEVYKVSRDMFLLDPLVLRAVYGDAFRYRAPRGYEQV